MLKMVLIIIFLALRTPQRNGVVERKNRTLVDIARKMLVDSSLSKNC